MHPKNKDVYLYPVSSVWTDYGERQVPITHSQPATSPDCGRFEAFKNSEELSAFEVRLTCQRRTSKWSTWLWPPRILCCSGLCKWDIDVPKGLHTDMFTNYYSREENRSPPRAVRDLLGTEKTLFPPKVVCSLGTRPLLSTHEQWP